MKGNLFPVTCFLAATLILGGYTPNYVSAEENSSQNACVWLTDHGYSYAEDIGGEEMSSVKVADFHNSGGWPVMGNDGIITDELWNFSASGYGSDYAKITEDGKYLYFLSDISSDCGSGTLYRAELSQINNDLEQKEIIEIDSDVSCLGGISNMESAGGIYQRWSGELCYFDGTEASVIVSDARWYQIVDSEYIFYSVSTDEDEYSLYGMKLGDETSRMEIVSNTNFGMCHGGSSLESPVMGIFHAVDKDHVYYMTIESQSADLYIEDFQPADLYVAGYGTGPEPVVQNIIPVMRASTGEALLYIPAEVQEYVNLFTEMIDISNSEHSEEEINLLFELLREEDSINLRPLYCYNFDSGKSTFVGEFFTENMCFPVCGDGVIACMYMEPQAFLKAFLGDTRISVDTILDDDRYAEDNWEGVLEIMSDWTDQQVGNVENPDYPWTCSFINAETGDTIGSTDLIMGEVLSMQIFDHGERLAVLGEEGEIYTAEITEGVDLSISHIGAEDVSEIHIYGDELCYEADKCLYIYKNHQQTELGNLRENYIYNFYEDGSILLMDDYIDRKYGGTLYYISDTGGKKKVGDDVTSFMRLQSGEVLYLSEQKLVLYSEGEKTRIADDVKQIWSANEKKFVSTSQLGW